MSLDYARDLWRRARNALRSAEVLLNVSGDDAASRAYYAAFHAVSALFVVRGMSFSKHSAVRAALHRELVNRAEWEAGLGEAFDVLWELRDMGDYGGEAHVTPEEAARALNAAQMILEAALRSEPTLEP